jgi:hypothetical protein
LSGGPIGRYHAFIAANVLMSCDKKMIAEASYNLTLWTVHGVPNTVAWKVMACMDARLGTIWMLKR